MKHYKDYTGHKYYFNELSEELKEIARVEVIKHARLSIRNKRKKREGKNLDLWINDINKGNRLINSLGFLKLEGERLDKTILGNLLEFTEEGEYIYYYKLN